MTAGGAAGGAAGVALGLDPGSVRVGLAATDETGTIATPVAVLPRRPEAALWRRLRDEVRRRRATTAVVGLPRRLDGSEGGAAAEARAFAESLAAQTGLPVELWDERLTSREADRSLVAAGVRRRGRRERVDAVAASLMLQTWLERGRRRS